jgi:hypothetical protein
MEAEDNVEEVEADETNVEEAPEVLRVYVPGRPVSSVD